MTSASLPSSAGLSQGINNELDLRVFLYALWRTKFIVIACALAFAFSLLIHSFVVRQEWTGIAIIDRPTVNVPGNYFSSEAVFKQLECENIAMPNFNSSLNTNKAYQEFLRRRISYNTRRDFWLNSSYQTHKNSDTYADIVLLDELINAIKHLPYNDIKKAPDYTQLVAETALDANQLLHCYMDFANQHTAKYLNEDIMTAWASCSVSPKPQVKRQEMVALALYQREHQQLNQALKLAFAQGINRSRTDVTVKNLPKSKMFLLSQLLLQTRLDTLQAAGSDL